MDIEIENLLNIIFPPNKGGKTGLKKFRDTRAALKNHSQRKVYKTYGLNTPNYKCLQKGIAIGIEKYFARLFYKIPFPTAFVH